MTIKLLTENKQLDYNINRKINIRINIRINKNCIPFGLGLNFTELPFESYDLLIVILIFFTIYQLYKRMNQIIKIVTDRNPQLKEEEKKIMFYSRLILTFLVSFVLLFIIGDLFYDFSHYFFVQMGMKDNSIKLLKVIKYLLLLILKPLLIYINYLLHGLKSLRFWITIGSALFFIIFLIISFSSYLNITIFQETFAFIFTLSLSLVSLSSLGELGSCNMMAKGSKLVNDITSEFEEEDVNKDKKNSKGRNTRRARRSNHENSIFKKRIKHPKNPSPAWVKDYNFYRKVWAPAPLKLAQADVKTIINKETLINKLDTVNKTIEDINIIQSGGVAKYNYFRPKNLPCMVTVPEAKEAFESDREVVKTQLTKVVRFEVEKFKNETFKKDYYYILRNKRFDNVRYIEEAKYSTFPTRHKRAIVWNVKQGLGHTLKFSDFTERNLEERSRTIE